MADSTIKSVRRAFEVLEYFEEVAKPLSLKEVAARFGYPTSSTAAMLKSLMLLGYLNYDARSRTYIPTLRLAELGTWAKDALLHEELLRTTIARLSARTRETVSVGTQSDVYMQYLHVAYPDEPLQFHVKPGTVRLLTRSGMGMALLSACEDDTIELLWRRCNRVERAHRASVTLTTLKNRIQETRANGYALSRNLATQGAAAVAMLLPSRFYSRQLAISVGGPVWRIDENLQEIVQEMRAVLAD